MSNDSAWYARYPAHYRLDTTHLSLAEHGAYTLLLDYYYGTGKLPADKATLHRICHAHGRFERDAVDHVCHTFFTTNSDGKTLSHSRVERELAKRKVLSEQRSKAGKCSALVRQVLNRSQDSVEVLLPTSTTTSTKDQKQGRSPKEELVWTDGLQFLVDGGTPEAQARSSLGRMVKQYGVVILADAICDAAVQNPTGNRVAYLQAVLKGTKRDAGSSDDMPYRMV